MSEMQDDVIAAREIALRELERGWNRQKLSASRREIGRKAVISGVWDRRAEVQIALLAIRQTREQCAAVARERPDWLDRVAMARVQELETKLAQAEEREKTLLAELEKSTETIDRITALLKRIRLKHPHTYQFTNGIAAAIRAMGE